MYNCQSSTVSLKQMLIESLWITMTMHKCELVLYGLTVSIENCICVCLLATFTTFTVNKTGAVIMQKSYY